MKHLLDSHPHSRGHRLYAHGTAFTYHGRLNSGGVPANGTYYFLFTIFFLLGGFFLFFFVPRLNTTLPTKPISATSSAIAFSVT